MARLKIRWPVGCVLILGLTVGCGGKQTSSLEKDAHNSRQENRSAAKETARNETANKQGAPIALPITDKAAAVKAFQGHAIPVIPESLHEQMREFVVRTVRDSEQLAARKTFGTCAT